MKYLRISQVSTFFKSPDYIEYLEKTEKRSRTMSMKKAMKIGSRVDELVKTAKEPLAKDCSEVHAAHRSYMTWAHNYPHWKVEPGERLFNNELGITGEPDLYINEREISDIKCSLEIRFEYWVQLGGYLLLPSPFPIDRVSILRLDKNGSQYEYVVREDVHTLKTLFIGELNKVRAYIKHNNEEEKYGSTHLYYDRESRAIDSKE